jgi:hypothetical protein
MKWTTGEMIAGQLLRRWRRGDFLAARLTGESLFPLELKLKRPSARELAQQFGAAQDWVSALVAASRQGQGFGFDLRFQASRNRVQGVNELPVAAVFHRESDALRLIRRQADADRFQSVADDTLSRHPSLSAWLARRPLVALEHADCWDTVLTVLDWFIAHPRPGLYARQLDIPGVDTKFIETHRALLTQLLEVVLPEEAVDPGAAAGVKGFLQRFGLREEPPLVRFRLLDPRLFIDGLSDLSLPPEQFAALHLPLRLVFITENQINGLAFPAHPGSMVIFGLGYGLDRLAGVEWLPHVDVRYWGDIDTHGFGILDRLRATLPEAQSFLMDRQTLEAHRDLWGQEPPDGRYTGPSTRLRAAEQELLEDLRADRLGQRVRLEQERISYGWLKRALADRVSRPQSSGPVMVDQPRR